MASIHPVSIWSKRTAFRIFLRFDQIRRDRPKNLFLDIGTWDAGCRHYDVIISVDLYYWRSSWFEFSKSWCIKNQIKILKIFPKWFPLVSIPGVASSRRFICEILFLKSLLWVDKSKIVQNTRKIFIEISSRNFGIVNPAWNEYSHQDMCFCLTLFRVSQNFLFSIKNIIHVFSASYIFCTHFAII